VNQFEIDELYPERSLNEIIKRSHSDTATLRREVIGWLDDAARKWGLLASAREPMARGVSALSQKPSICCQVY